MAERCNQYIDTKNRVHCVEHFTLPADDCTDKERIMDELLYALTKDCKHTRT